MEVRVPILILFIFNKTINDVSANFFLKKVNGIFFNLINFLKLIFRLILKKSADAFPKKTFHMVFIHIGRSFGLDWVL